MPVYHSVFWYYQISLLAIYLVPYAMDIVAIGALEHYIWGSYIPSHMYIHIEPATVYVHHCPVYIMHMVHAKKGIKKDSLS